MTGDSYLGLDIVGKNRAGKKQHHGTDKDTDKSYIFILEYCFQIKGVAV